MTAEARIDFRKMGSTLDAVIDALDSHRVDKSLETAVALLTLAIAGLIDKGVPLSSVHALCDKCVEELAPFPQGGSHAH